MLLPQLDAFFAKLLRLADGATTASTSLQPGALQRKGAYGVEVKIGVSDSPRELVFNSSQTPAEVEDLVKSALAEAGSPGGSSVLALTDDKGKRILVQAAKISYLEIGAADVRRVGFGIAPEASA
jgi:hypothetical protein